MNSVPFVVERSGQEERVLDVYSCLLKQRIVFLQGQINDESAESIVAQLLYLHFEDPKADIHMYINSPGGVISSGLSIYDTMQYVSCDVATYCLGQCCSMGAVLLPAGAKGKRFSLPHSRIMIHQPMSGARGTTSDILLSVNELRRVKKQMNEILLKHTGQTLDKIEADTDRDNWMTAPMALEYGIIDHIIDKIPESHVKRPE